MARTRYRFFETEYPYFLTDTVVAWLPLFSHKALVEVVFDSWRYLQKQWDVRILGYVVMENHLHWIAASSELGEYVRRFKSYTARQIVDTLQQKKYATLLQELHYYKRRHKIDQDYQIWQEGSHPQQIQNEPMLRQKLEYMHNNPLRRGYVGDPVHWRYSSAGDYAGTVGVIEVCKDWL